MAETLQIAPMEIITCEIEFIWEEKDLQREFVSKKTAS